MKLVLPSKTLKRILTQLSPSCFDRTPHAYMSGVLIETDENGNSQFTCDSYSLRFTINHQCGKKAIEEAGTALVPFKPLHSFMSRLEGTAVLHANDKFLNVTCGDAATKMPTIDSDDFPARKDGLQLAFEMLDAETLMNAVEFASKFIGDDKRTWWQQNISIVSEADALNILSTQGVALGRCELEPVSTRGRWSVVGIPFMKAVSSFEPSGWITMSIQDTQIVLQQDELTAYILCPEGLGGDMLATSVELSKAVESGALIEINREALLNAVRAAACILTSNDFSVEFSVEDSKFTVNAASDFTGGTFSESIACTTNKCKPLAQKLNRSQVETALAAMSSDSVIVKMAEKARAARIVSDNYTWLGALIVPLPE